MSKIFVFRKDMITLQFAQIRDFDNENDLELWLSNTTYNKDDLIILEEYKRRKSK